MLLRRITQHVKDQNWFAVFLDFFIVVAGILIAFQITNWNEAREQRILENHYLERLVEDMDESIAGNERGINFVKYNQANAWVIHQSLKACEIPDGQEDSFADGLYQIGRYTPVDYELETIHEMLSAGNFSVIRNPEIRSRLNGLVSDSTDYLELVPSISGRVSQLLVQFDRYLIINREHIKPMSGSISNDEVKFDFQAMV